MVRDTPGRDQICFLLVEDDDLVARAYGRALARYGAVHLARSVLEAYLAIADLRMTGVVTDISLPDGSGLDVAREARARAPGLPILIVSGSVDAIRLDVADELRASYLLKPVEPAQLARFAERAIVRQHRVAAHLAEWVERYRLSAVESLTLQLSIEGHRREEIATVRGVSPSTVKNQIATLLAKVGEPSIAKAITAFYAELSGLQ